jgi:hypothetical protein
MQHRMEEMNPRVGMRLRHSKELALHFLDGMLLQGGQHEAQLVSHRG